jgi:F0F1-type ATP synthase beta subunit
MKGRRARLVHQVTRCMTEHNRPMRVDQIIGWFADQGYRYIPTTLQLAGVLRRRPEFMGYGHTRTSNTNNGASWDVKLWGLTEWDGDE